MKPIDIDILRAVGQRWAGEDRWVHDILDKPERLIERRMERLIDKGYLECGVSTRTAWLTEKGCAVIGLDYRRAMAAYDIESHLGKVAAAIASDLHRDFGLPDDVRVEWRG